MLRTDAGLRSTHEALLNLQFALLGLYEEKAKYGTKGFQMMGEAIVADVLKLRKEIDDLIGLTDYVAEFGVPPTDAECDAMSPPEVRAPAASGTVAGHHPAANPR